MRPGATVGDQLVADAAREREVGDAVPVEVAELAPPNPEFEAAEAVRRGLHSGPRLHGGCDVFSS